MTKQALEEAIRKLLQQLKNAHKYSNDRNHLFWGRRGKVINKIEKKKKSLSKSTISAT